MSAEKPQVKIKSEAEMQDFSIYLIAVFVILLTLLIIFIFRRRSSARRSVLLMGLSDSGKTLLYSQLLHSKFVQSHTSIKENTGEYMTNKKSLKIVDIPGHERMRNKFFDQHKSSAKAIVYVIDSLTLQKEVRDVAEFLYVILTDSAILSSVPKILILCNKQDEMLSKGSSVIKTLLEKEMNTLRITQSSQLESVDPSQSKNVYLGRADKDFDFSAVPPYSIEFAESQATENSTDINALVIWLAKIA